jgi:hypothetical protein
MIDFRLESSVEIVGKLLPYELRIRIQSRGTANLFDQNLLDVLAEEPSSFPITERWSSQTFSAHIPPPFVGETLAGWQVPFFEAA